MDKLKEIKKAFSYCPLGVNIFNTSLDLVYANDIYFNLTNTVLGDIESAKYLDVIHPNDIDNVLSTWKTKMEISPYEFDMTYRLKLIDGKVIWVNVKSRMILDNGELLGFIDIVQDKSEEKNYEEKILTEIMESEDMERRRFANELHDGLGQNLTAAFLNLETIRDKVSSLDIEAVEKFNTGVNFISEAINETRSIAHNIMPKAIDDFGFTITVEGMIEGLKEVSTIVFTFYHNLGESRISAATEFNLYRITQEAINNILKHSEAKQATIQLIKHETNVILTIEDDGVGFNKEKIGKGSMDFGINSMINRANSIMASINIDSHVNQGTTLTIEAPIQ
ncbi:MAG: PAS domain-containing sensor histidine kinase [Flavobacteriales bacterium]|nr:PAS domain-containing sensor histidine kinase [Flavobacteriales bacterium]